jgi:pyruvate,water dikinase
MMKGNILLSGLAASPGAASGVVKIVKSMTDLSKVKTGDILVTKMTNPDMVVTMQRAVAVITDEGGATAHAAIVSREMGIPCVVGTERATEILKDGQIVTVDGTNGKVYEGKAFGELAEGKKEVLPIVKTKTKIKVMVDLPDFAERAAKSGCDSVGLLRLEGIIAEGGKHPIIFLKEDPEEYVKIIERGVERIARHFKNVWIRTSDIRSDEYRNLKGAPKEVEINPMLGMHGIRFSLKNLPIFEAELEAIRRVAEKHHDKKFGIMFPQIISEKEMEDAYKVFKKYARGNMIIGAMIETPAAVQVIREICKYARFISFGTNDLTQYTLAIDRGNSECQYLYDEMHPAVLSQIKKVIMVCKQYKVESSICGQAGSKKEMVEFLVKNGIDSISVNADMAQEISLLVQELEGVAKKEKDKNPENHPNNMGKKATILPIDETSHIGEKGEKKFEKKMKENKKKEIKEDKQEVESTTVVREDLRGKEVKEEEKDSKEFPEFEIGFDPFADQSKK